MSDCGVRGMQAIGQLAGGRVVRIKLFQQIPLKGFDGMFETVDRAVVLTRHGGAGDIQVAYIHLSVFADGGRAKNHVLQLPHVAWPAVAEQGRVGAGCEPADRTLNLCARLFHEVSGQ